MAATHDYDTRLVLPAALDETMVLVGESGGMSAIVETVEQAEP